MSTYQDRATKILLAFGEYYHLQELNKFGVYDMAKEFPDELSLKQALSELGSIVEEEKRAEGDYATIYMTEQQAKDYRDNRSLRQRDQLSNRSLPMSDEDNKEEL